MKWKISSAVKKMTVNKYIADRMGEKSLPTVHI